MVHSDEAFVDTYLKESVDIMTEFANATEFRQILVEFAQTITNAFRAGNKVLIAGNGGSAGDAQHIAGEFISRLFFDHAPLPAIALTTDTSVMTAVGNDYGFEKVFERQVLGLGKPSDIFLGISTSGKSPNVLKALDAARSLGMVTMGFAGRSGGSMNGKCDLILCAPSDKTSLIQQIHIVAAHIICGLAEAKMFGELRQKQTA
jgi:D-sedoheptulose 7-phosphate isomerase